MASVEVSETEQVLGKVEVMETVVVSMEAEKATARVVVLVVEKVLEVAKPAEEQDLPI